MAFMNRYDSESKFEPLLDALTDCDRRRRYSLALATCYCNPNAVRRFIDAIQSRLNIFEIFLYLDRKDAVSIGHSELSALEEDYSELLSIFCINAGRLFHTKGYCLAAYTEGELTHGRLAIGSATGRLPCPSPSSPDDADHLPVIPVGASPPNFTFPADSSPIVPQ